MGAIFALCFNKEFFYEELKPLVETPEEKLHITLVYLDSDAQMLDDLAISDLNAIASRVASRMSAITGHTNGSGNFKTDDGYANFLNYDAPKLEILRQQLIWELEESGYDFSKDHIFQPHITIGYSKSPVSIPITDLHINFGSLSFMVDDNVNHYEFETGLKGENKVSHFIQVSETNAEEEPIRNSVNTNIGIHMKAIAVGDFVSWDSSGGTARGRVDKILTSGKTPESAGSVSATEEDPAALISIYKEDENEWIESSITVGHKVQTLKKIEALKAINIDLTPTDAMARNASRALEVRAAKPPSQRGMTSVGLARARQLINKQELSPDTVARMYSFFSRHEVDKQGSTWNEKGKGWQAWQGWGGDAGFAWSKRKVAQLDKKGALEKSENYECDDGVCEIVPGFKATKNWSKKGEPLENEISVRYIPFGKMDSGGQWWDSETNFHLYDQVIPGVVDFHGAAFDGGKAESVGQVKKTYRSDDGYWADIDLDQDHPRYQAYLKAMEDGNLYVSPGAIGAYFQYEKTGRISDWATGEISLIIADGTKRPKNWHAISKKRSDGMLKAMGIPKKRKGIQQKFLDSIKSLFMAFDVDPDLVDLKIQKVMAQGDSAAPVDSIETGEEDMVLKPDGSIEVNGPEDQNQEVIAEDVREESTEELKEEVSAEDIKKEDQNGEEKSDASKKGDDIDSDFEYSKDKEKMDEIAQREARIAELEDLLAQKAQATESAFNEADNAWFDSQVASNKAAPAEKDSVLEDLKALRRADASMKAEGNSLAARYKLRVEARANTGVIGAAVIQASNPDSDEDKLNDGVHRLLSGTQEGKAIKVK